jgi:hypothetical protein
MNLMPLKLTVGITRKLGLPEYSSVGASCHVELPLPIEAAEALAKRQAAHQDQLLSDDPIGRDIARLEAERDTLLDTVWLACSTAQIKQLWSKVATLLGEEPTRLEREALAIAPIEEA